MCINFRLLLAGSWAGVLDGLSEARSVSWWALTGPHRVPEDLSREGTHFSPLKKSLHTHGCAHIHAHTDTRVHLFASASFFLFLSFRQLRQTRTWNARTPLARALATWAAAWLGLKLVVPSTPAPLSSGYLLQCLKTLVDKGACYRGGEQNRHLRNYSWWWATCLLPVTAMSPTHCYEPIAVCAPALAPRRQGIKGNIIRNPC